MTRNLKAELKLVNAVLWRDWDPIGCGVPEDEYETYAPEALRLLLAGKRAPLIDYLCETAATALLSPVSRQKAETVADKLLALGIKQER